MTGNAALAMPNGIHRVRPSGPAWIVLPLLLLVPIALMGPNVGLGLGACAILAAGTWLLWRPTEPPILLFIFLYQWVQASLATFYANLQGETVDAMADFGGSQETGIMLSQIGLLVLCLAMRIGAGPAQPYVLDRLRGFVAAYPLRSFAALYVLALGFSIACKVAAGLSAGLTQPLLALAELKWVAFLLLTVATYAVPGRARTIWLLAFFTELGLSLGGFFADFANPFFYSIIGIAASNVRTDRQVVMPLALASVAMLLVASAWSEVKTDYRSYLNDGTGQQIVAQSYSDRMAELSRLVSEVDGAALASGADKLARRLAYTEFFGLVTDRVPYLTPHTGGEIWGQALTRPFMPRLVFADKSAVSDTMLTSRYTGISTYAFMNSSISMGYMADAYIDFGPRLMFAAVFLLGLGIGLLHRWLMHQPWPRNLIGPMLVPVVLMPAHLFDASIVKILPTLFLTGLVALVVIRLPLTQLLGALGGPDQRTASAGRRHGGS
jgi:hypothetical protein